MKIRIALSILIYFTGTFIVFSQDLKVKKDEILLDNQPFLKYEKITLAEYSIKDLAGNEILFFQTKEDPTTKLTFMSFNFVPLKKKIESDNIGRISGLGSKSMIDKLITWLIRDKVLNTNGTVNAEQLEIFSDKYNDHKSK